MKVICPRCDTIMMLCGYDQKDTTQQRLADGRVIFKYTGAERFVCPLCNKRMSVETGEHTSAIVALQERVKTL